MLPAFMAERNRFGAPYWCIIISTVVAMLIGYSGGFAFLASISVVSRFSQYIPTCLSIMVFRKKCRMHRVRLRFRSDRLFLLLL